MTKQTEQWPEVNIEPESVKTSTPVSRRNTKCKLKLRRNKKVGKYIKKAKKDRLRKRLEEAANVELSTTGSELESKEDFNKQASKEDFNSCDGPEGTSSNGGNLSKTSDAFDTLSSGTNEQLLRLLDEYASASDNSSSAWEDSSDPSLDGCIIGLADSDKIFHNPFELSDSIRREIVRRSEASGGRILNWSLSSFDRVGGSNTLRSVWAKLKGDERVRGNKRHASDSGDPDEEKKKLKVSLNLSSTCLDLENIGLHTTSGSESTSDTRGISCDLSVIALRDGNVEAEMLDDTFDSGERVFSEYDEESDSMPDLTSSDPPSESGDSGRSDTWAASQGIWGARPFRKDEVARGIVTETERANNVAEGYETDDVIDYELSQNSIGSPVWHSVSNETDEGISLHEDEQGYMDDMVVTIGLDDDAERLNNRQLYEDANGSNDELLLGSHGGPSIAGSQSVGNVELLQVVQADISEACQGAERCRYGMVSETDVGHIENHGRLSIAGIQGVGNGELVQFNTLEMKSTSHGGLGIEGTQGHEHEREVNGLNDESGSNKATGFISHGRSSIAEPNWGGQWEV